MGIGEKMAPGEPISLDDVAEQIVECGEDGVHSFRSGGDVLILYLFVEGAGELHKAVDRRRDRP